jgi:hypothetical protein
MVLRKRRYRDLKKVGIGGFLAKTRAPKTALSAKKDEETEEKKRPTWRPKKNKILVQYPEYIQAWSNRGDSLFLILIGLKSGSGFLPHRRSGCRFCYHTRRFFYISACSLLKRRHIFLIRIGGFLIRIRLYTLLRIRIQKLLSRLKMIFFTSLHNLPSSLYLFNLKKGNKYPVSRQ